MQARICVLKRGLIDAKRSLYIIFYLDFRWRFTWKFKEKVYILGITDLSPLYLKGYFPKTEN